MKFTLTVLIISAAILGGFVVASAENPKDKVKVEIKKTSLDLGLDPGLYVCAGKHLHIQGTVQNVTDKTLVSVKLEGKAYDAGGKIIATAHPRKLKPLPLSPLKPGQKNEFDLEFRELMGEKILMVKKREVVVVEARH